MIRHSIRARLTAWYAGSVLLLLLTGTWAARSYVRQSIEEEFARSQDAAAMLVSGFFRVEVAEYRDIEGTLGHIVGELVIPDRHIHFVRPDGSDYLPPPGVRVMPLPVLAPPLRTVHRPLDPDLAPGWQVRLTSSAAPLARQLAAVDRGALLAIPLAVLLAIVLGWVLTGRTLRPVAAMADAADRISADAYGRLPVAVPDDELGRLGIRFNALLDRLDQAIATQRRFLADAAHELRTPIARARGVGDLALSQPAGAEDRNALQRTQRELEVMSRLVDELLELARSDASRGAALQPGFLDDVVTDVVGRFDGLARRNGVALLVEVPEEAPVRMDAASVARLVGILVDNAIRYTLRGGSVRVAVSAGPDASTLVVEDSGIGIPAAERHRLFERFFRGAAARELAPDGSGLGLPIARAVAERHGARIEIAEHAPRGTRISVRFPRA
ncbi:MAG: HAMP domain-containing protein [Gemmatimonadaceae bacterium]|nr:HAMP domain-containing protein [Gemmatimonadaceae bacterium]MCW5826636.1 HAMP domain-containing protein [Gemmatimonadaceae bacterium]